MIGFVGMGSTAERHRVDEWSDHDFALVTVDGAEDRYRHDLSWLPAAASIALSVVESHGGVKVIYADGHVLEFGITSLAGLANWAGNAYEVFYDAGGVTEAFAAVVAKPLPTGARNDAADIRLVLTQVLIGIGRYRRGEVLSAGESVRSEALAYLLRVLGPPPAGRRSDCSTRSTRAGGSSSCTRSWLRSSPQRSRLTWSSSAGRCSTSPNGNSSRGWDDFPREGLAAVRARLGWD